MMRKLLAILLCCFVMFTFAACNASDNTADDKVSNSMNVENLGDTMSYTITKVYTSEQLLPENTEGFYRYYEASKGNTLFIVEMDVTNISEDFYRIWLLGEAKLSIANKDYEADIAVKFEDQNDTLGNGNVEIDSGESLHVYYLFDIPAKFAGEQAVLSMTSNEQTSSHNVKAE